MKTRLEDTARYFRNFNASYVVLFAVLSLSVLGLIVLASAGRASRGGADLIFQKQLIWFCLALSAGGVAAVIDLEHLRRHMVWIALAVVVLLVLVSIPGIGVKVNGARRWLDLGLMRLQVSDLARPALILIFAHYLSKHQRELATFTKGFLVPCGMLGLLCALILIQPDFGTAFLCGVVGFTLLFLAGARLIFWLPTLLSAVSLFAVAIYLNPVRFKRITTFLDVEAQKADGGLQPWQSTLAFGSGGWGGVGLGNGRQSLNLPEAHTDFIFPIMGEELGYFCTTGVVFVFLAFFGVVTWQLRKAPSLYHFLIVSGAILFITLQALINMGVVTVLLPTKGMSLPFISYGGSNLMMMFVLVGLIVNCFCHWSAPPLRKTRDL